MASGFKYKGQDFDSVFQPITGSSVPTTTNYNSGASDIVDFYEPLARDQQLPDIGYYYNGNNLSELLMGNTIQFPKVLKTTTGIDIGWNVEIEYLLTVDFTSVQARNDFFKYGGRIILRSEIFGTGSTSRDTEWRNLLQSIGTIEFGNTNTYQNDDTVLSSVGLQDLTTNYKLIGSFSAYDSIGTGTIRYRITAKLESTNSKKLIFRVWFDNDLPSDQRLNPSNYIVHGSTRVYATERKYPTMESPLFSAVMNPEDLYSNFVYKVYPSNPQRDSKFGVGRALSDDGSTLIVGSFNRNSSKGAVYVYTRKSNGLFGPTEDQYIPRPSGFNEKYFGIGIVSSGDGLSFIVKSKQYYVYVYRRPDKNSQFTLFKTFISHRGFNGIGISYDGEYVSMGSPEADGNNGEGYIYKLNSSKTNYVLHQTLSEGDQNSCGVSWYLMGDRIGISKDTDAQNDARYVSLSISLHGTPLQTDIYKREDSTNIFKCIDVVYPAHPTAFFTPVFFGLGGRISRDGDIYTCSDAWAKVRTTTWKNEAGCAYFFRWNPITNEYDLITLRVSPNPKTGGRFGFTRMTLDGQWMIIGESGAERAYVYKYDQSVQDFVINETLMPYDNNYGKYGNGEVDSAGKTFVVTMTENDYTYNGTYVKNSGCCYIYYR